MDKELLTEPELSRLYHAFRAPRRRLVLQLLAEEPVEPLTMKTLGREIAACEVEGSSDATTGELYRNVYNALSQTHLPR